jgi:hypothetical protein
VTGPLGSGKSFFAVRKMAQALVRGRAVFGNVELRPGWEAIVARHNPYIRYGSRKAREEYEVDLLRRYHYEPSLERLTKVRLHGRGEGRGLLVLDEAHNDLNNRDWQSTQSKEFLRWLTLVRKKGIVVYIVSQHRANTDAGARRIATTMIQVVNYKQVTRIPVLGVSLLPVPVFRAFCFLNEESSVKGQGREKPLWKEIYTLTWHRRLYGTTQLFGEDEDEPDAIWLPRPRAEVEAERAARVAAASESAEGARRRLGRRAAPGAQRSPLIEGDGRTGPGPATP